MYSFSDRILCCLFTINAGSTEPEGLNFYTCISPVSYSTVQIGDPGVGAGERPPGSVRRQISQRERNPGTETDADHGEGLEGAGERIQICCIISRVILDLVALLSLVYM